MSAKPAFKIATTSKPCPCCAKGMRILKKKYKLHAKVSEMEGKKTETQQTLEEVLWVLKSRLGFTEQKLRAVVAWVLSSRENRNPAEPRPDFSGMISEGVKMYENRPRGAAAQ